MEVDRDSGRPHNAWEWRLKSTVSKLRDVKQKELIEVSDEERADGTERSKTYLRFVCISDTHSRVERTTMERVVGYKQRIPWGDVLLHAGDFTMYGDPDEVTKFNTFLGELPHKFKIVIPGNHETSFDPRFGINNGKLGYRSRQTKLPDSNGATSNGKTTSNGLVDLLTNAIYLQDTLLEFFGIKIYGVPWMPEFASWGFGMHRGYQLLQMYNLIPAGVDILLSHGPTVGIGDVTSRGEHVGCVELFNSVRQRIKPKFFVCGHIHEGYGIRNDGTTTYINAAVCNKNYKPVHDPIVFDLKLPTPLTTDQFHQLTREDLKLTWFTPLDGKS